MRSSSTLYRSVRPLACAATLVVCSAATMLHAQEAIRPSLAGESESEARRQSLDKIPYNLMLGPLRFRVSATAGVEYNDNVNLAEDNTHTFATPTGNFTLATHAQSDWIFRPQVNLDMLWPITQLNTLRFDIGIGHAFYFNHSNYDTNSILVSPNSQLAFDIFVGDFRINIHDRFSLQQDPVSEISLSNVADYGHFENTAGISVLWDLNQAVVTAGYDHYTFIATNDLFDYLNRNAEEFTGSIDFTVSNTTGVGIEGSFVHTYYDQSLLNDNDTYSVGAFLETQITSYLKVRVAGGYQDIEFDDGGAVNDTQNLSDYYANILLSHRINAQITQSISAGHENQLGVNSNYITLNYIRHTATWNVFLHTLLSTELFYEDANDSGGLGPFPGRFYNPFAAEKIHRYGGALTVGYQLTPHVTLGLRYQYTQKDSNLPLRDYRQNRISLDGTYSF
jgi:hypothetical protein